ncbi:hypothetical protein K493DRAFT_355288 [Basidiobolus meristosporus CBS 931.73]|uniref:R3H domain-containing protein n=1 Tax=Basidiobolus meristosporus CBS 931.73 TaxID=1314790 RepID=A0A1Y1Y148_9FUNG|nr:hypothetical protein K493DRAFT_355288 [Basidiobolus meristosporus CBS 931.73]|eukprot:ORX91742.1 hypothetical protein K493DRAFT_355288 [Basidiobolus meristosporus CBS 931.73]
MAVDTTEFPITGPTLSPEQHTGASAEAPPLRVPRVGKKKIYFQRDSLKSRESKGKEGSRRRKRYDNDHFTHLPHAVLNPKDLAPPGYPAEAPRFHFKYDRAMQQLLQHNFIHDIDLRAMEKTPQCPESQSYIHRSIRRELKKAHVSEGIVERHEIELIEFIKQILEREGQLDDMEEVPEGVSDYSSTDSDDDTDIDSKHLESFSKQQLFLVMNIQDRQIRFVVHAMCQYYHLMSFSKDTRCGRRLTYVCHPRLVFPNSQKSPGLREKTFYEFVFL